MDPEKATRAAARHLRDLYNMFGDWYLAIAAYNCGPGTVEKAVERTGYADFWELRRRGVLPAETTNYVPIILAMTIMEKNASEYGLQGLNLEPPMEYDTVEMTAVTGMPLLADILDVPQSELASLNPAVLGSTIPASFPVHVPKGTGNQVMAAIANVPEENRRSWRMHRVAPGETIAAIGKRYNASPGSISSVNKLASADCADGDLLLIPASSRPEPVRIVRTVKSGKTAKTTARRTASVRSTRSSRPAAASISRSVSKSSVRIIAARAVVR